MTHVHGEIMRFGHARGVPALAVTVMDLYDAALRPSSQRTYRTGQRAYSRFINSLTGGSHFPFLCRQLQDTELNLAFYMAFLLLQPTIRRASTILSYETHVKYLFKEEGCPESGWDTPFLRQLRKGLKNTLPTKADSRAPLLLPLIMSSPEFITIHNNEQRLLRFVTILGFMGMMRPHSLEALNPESFTFVTEDGHATPMPRQPRHFVASLHNLGTTRRILGFYEGFRSKTMP